MGVFKTISYKYRMGTTLIMKGICRKLTFNRTLSVKKIISYKSKKKNINKIVQIIKSFLKYKNV